MKTLNKLFSNTNMDMVLVFRKRYLLLSTREIQEMKDLCSKLSPTFHFNLQLYDNSFLGLFKAKRE